MRHAWIALGLLGACTAPPDQSSRDAGPDRLDAGSAADAEPGPADAGPPNGNPRCETTVTIQSAADVAAIAGCTEILGDLVVDAPELAAIELPVLQRVTGSLRVLDSPALRSLDLDELASARAIDFGATCGITHVDTPLLRGLPGILRIDPELVHVDVGCWRPGVEEADYVRYADVREATQLETLVLPDLSAQQLEGVEIIGNPRLTTVRISGAPANAVSYLWVFDNPALISLDADVFGEICRLKVLRNFELREVNLPSLRDAGCLYFEDNWWFPSCRIDALVAQLDQPPYGCTGGCYGVYDSRNWSECPQESP